MGSARAPNRAFHTHNQFCACAEQCALCARLVPQAEKCTPRMWTRPREEKHALQALLISTVAETYALRSAHGGRLLITSIYDLDAHRLCSTKLSQEEEEEC